VPYYPVISPMKHRAAFQVTFHFTECIMKSFA
jgi:hypothetical protein